MKKDKRNILLTFDYEPYLGEKSGSAQKCLIHPTDLLQTILTKYNSKAVFFIDALYILKLKEHVELQDDYIAVINQVKQLYKNGHFIFPHIHPHWLDAKYLPELKQFNLSNLKKYSLASFNDNQVEELFEKSFSLLKELDINYSEWGYRAGGWCIQPFNKYINIFKKYNIKYEFSVLPNYKNEKPEQYFDFSNVVKKTPFYFNDDLTIALENGEFMEFPISTIKISNKIKFYSRVVNKYLWKTNDKGFGDGISAQTAALKTTEQNSEMISIDIFNIAKLISYKNYIINTKYMHFISHPKMFTKHGLNTFDKFLKYAHQNFNVDYNFK